MKNNIFPALTVIGTVLLSGCTIHVNGANGKDGEDGKTTNLLTHSTYECSKEKSDLNLTVDYHKINGDCQTVTITGNYNQISINNLKKLEVKGVSNKIQITNAEMAIMSGVSNILTAKKIVALQVSGVSQVIKADSIYDIDSSGVSNVVETVAAQNINVSGISSEVYYEKSTDAKKVSVNTSGLNSSAKQRKS